MFSMWVHFPSGISSGWFTVKFLIFQKVGSPGYLLQTRKFANIEMDTR